MKYTVTKNYRKEEEDLSLEGKLFVFKTDIKKINPELFILARTQRTLYQMVSLTNGNRYHNKPDSISNCIIDFALFLGEVTIIQ